MEIIKANNLAKIYWGLEKIWLDLVKILIWFDLILLEWDAHRVAYILLCNHILK